MINDYIPQIYDINNNGEKCIEVIGRCMILHFPFAKLSL